MSDTRPARPGRDQARGEISIPVTMPPQDAPAIASEPAPLQAVDAAAPPAATAEPRPAAAAATDGWVNLAAAQAALARGLEEATVEVTGLTRSGIAASTDAALALLGARTIAEVVEINAALARRGVDTLIAGSAKLSEIGVKTIAEASRPILSQFGAIRPV